MDNGNQFRNILLEYHKNIENIINLMKSHDVGEQRKDETTELSNYDNHPAELASELFQVEFNNGLLVHEENILRDIDDALKRIDKGTYGKCTFCGEEIATERLEILPHTRLCIDCENNEKLKRDNVARRRPVEELVWDAPFGRKYLNSREDDEFEGIDQLNDLMKFGSADTPQDLGGYEDYEEYYTNEIDKQGIVDRMDNISNEQYKRQLPD